MRENGLVNGIAIACHTGSITKLLAGIVVVK